MNHRTLFWVAIIVHTLIVVGTLAAARGDPAFAQPHAEPFTPRVSAPVLSRAFTTRFAVIGDYGYAGADEAAVAAMVSGWNPDFIITLGDNNYTDGAQATIDPNIGQYYSNYIYPYLGTNFTPTVTITRNLFFPSLGNHDWGTAGAVPYLNYFSLPGNERYYDFIWGPVHFFALDSDPNEPSGTTLNSAQANWLNMKLATAQNTWNLVYFHHAPYSSGGANRHGNSVWMQWPYRAWGASAVLAGHEHDYERILKNGFPYFVNGLGGKSQYSFTAEVEPGSAFRFDANFGAMWVTADDAQIVFNFHSITDTVRALDTFTLTTKPSIHRAYAPLFQR